ncbi:MAG: FdrA family protein [Candidatus Nephthysia bennettiae]|uniref:FdrA family protein n=2 Tax=Candidatus Nephthysia bennettiae TaxID=3127016 RepID=A0A934K9Q7_9BACT|nr:FdrA family protein [Candidatus Dormibacteraeota bacterium]MBJ7615039.1 FdrA family protein [Candidatus Dormibacteraeota bacterium]PZR93261.1 MAG: FdrA family protein [Candidatus Dormibacteraeota bacterium]
MHASRRMLDTPGVEAAMAAMASDLNLRMLRDSGLWEPALEGAGQDELILAARGTDPEAAIGAAEAALTERAAPASAGPEAASRTVRTAAGRLRGANLALISVPGQHAVWSCWDALAAGLNVLCFSDNVSLDDELRLKHEALRRGLLFMGPDCGTAILDGVGLGFSNVVPRGPVGIVGASGTGIQQLSCLLAHQGVGISQAIGVGGRDLSPEIGGLMTREAIRRLEEDPETEVIIVVSKPARARLQARKPLFEALLAPGIDLTEVALRVGGGSLPAEPEPLGWEGPVHGIFSGGTLRDEAALIWGPDPRFSAIDYGADEFTRGRPHPMIDNSLRLDAIRRAEGLVYLDVVLGRGAHPDPAAELAPALEGRPALVALIGVEADPQRLSRQRAAFEAAGARVYLSNSRAARSLVGGGRP